jgi:predicted nucleotidyltransferase
MASISLDKIFPSSTFVDVLLFFLLHPQEETYLARVVRATGKLLIQVQRTVKRLEASGLVKKIKHGNKTFYRANASHAAFKDLKQMLIKTVIFSSKIEKELSLIKEKIVYGFIFGSTARNCDTTDSDIDLFLVGNLNHEHASHFSFSLSIEFGRAVNTVIYTLKDFKKKVKEEHSFITEVIRNPKIWLFGNEEEFEKIYR